MLDNDSDNNSDNDSDNDKAKNTVKTVTYRLKFIDSCRFMQDSLSNLVDNLSEINSKDTYNKGSMTTSLVKSINDYRATQDLLSNLVISLYKINNSKFTDNIRSMITSLNQSIDSCRFMQDELSNIVNNKTPYNILIEKFPNTCQLCNKDLNKFELLLRKGVYPYEYMDSWKWFKEESLPDKEYFYSELNKEHITDEDYAHAQKVWDTFKIKNLGEYHDLYVQSDTALLADVFEKFRDKCIEIYKLDPAHFLTAPGLAWQSCLKKTGIELDLLTDNDMLNMFENGIRGGICQASYRYAKANNEYMKNYDKNKESSYLQYLDANNLYGFAMYKKLPVDVFKWVDDLSIFTEDFMKNYDKESDIGYLFVVYVEYLRTLHKLHSHLPFLPERIKINKCDKLVCNLNDKENYLYMY